MAQSVIGALRVNLGLDSANFQKGAQKVSPALKAMKAQFVAVSAAAAAFGTAVSAAALKSAQEIDRAAKSARRLDASIGGFRALELAAGEAGVSLSGLANDVQTMNRELANVGTSGNADRALEKLGLSVADLAGLDADEKVAVIADRVNALGLSAGEATAVLRDLGVRNREMALLMIQGGDAIRGARAAIEDYGLALDSADAGAIEAANDQIARLGFIGQYAGQQLALQLVPAMGQLATVMTDSLREGGLLRGVIDGLAENVVRISTYVGTAATVFGVRYVGGLVAARLATLTFSGALTVLRGALIRTGVGALVVAAGELVYQFSRLVSASGGFGDAMSLLGDIAQEVWLRMGQGGQGLYKIISGAATGIGAAFMRAFAWIGEKWDSLVNGMREPFNKLMGAMGLDAEIGASDLGGTLGGVADAWKADALASIGEGGALIKKAATTPLDSLNKLREVLAGSAEDADGAADAADRLNNSLAGVDGGGAGGAGGGAGGVKGAADQAKDTLTDLQKKAQSAAGAIQQSFTSSFKGVLTGAQSLGDGVASVLSKLSDMLLDQAGNALFSGISNVLGSAITGIPGFANGTDSAPGGLAWVGEQGRELVNLPRGSQVIPNHKLGGLGGGKLDVGVSIGETGGLIATIRDEAGRVVASAEQGIVRKSVAGVYAASRERRIG